MLYVVNISNSIILNQLPNIDCLHFNSRYKHFENNYFLCFDPEIPL